MDTEKILTVLEQYGLRQPSRVMAFRGHVSYSPYGRLAVQIEIHEYAESRMNQDRFQTVAYALDGNPLVEGTLARSPEEAIAKLDWGAVGEKALEWLHRHDGYKVKDFAYIPEDPY